MIESFNNKLKIETLILEKEFNLIDQESPNSNQTLEINEKKNILKSITKNDIDNFIEINNKKIISMEGYFIMPLIHYHHE